MLKILEPYELENMGHNSTDYLHHLIEAKKLAYADLEYYVGDPAFMKTSPDQLLNDAFIAKRRTLLNSEIATERTDPDTSLTTTETTYLTVADSEGNMVSFINSLAGSFGSGVVVPGTGFAVQNRAVGLSMQDNKANTVAPRRKPFHTIIPGFVTKLDENGNESPLLSFGIVGGAQQPQAHVQFFLNLMLFDMDVQEAMDAPRFRHWEQNQVSFEGAISADVIQALEEMGHAPQNPLLSTAQRIFLGNNRGLLFGSGQAIMRLERGYATASDSRRDRGLMGY
jgi:gamma-glutamyltranspeptidase/glutathione hydrolase